MVKTYKKLFDSISSLRGHGASGFREILCALLVFVTVVIVIDRAAGQAVAPSIAPRSGEIEPRVDRSGWTDALAVRPFVIRADHVLYDRDLLRQELAQLTADICSTLHFKVNERWAEIYLFAREADYRDYLRRHFGDVLIRPALFVKKNGVCMIFAYRRVNMLADLRHESTHALLHYHVGEMPIWLDEGLAEYFEVARKDRAEANPYLAEVVRQSQLGWTADLDDLQRRRGMADMNQSQYRDSWAWVHFLLHGPPEGRTALDEYLKRIRDDQPDRGFRETLDQYMTDSRSKMLNHFRFR